MPSTPLGNLVLHSGEDLPAVEKGIVAPDGARCVAKEHGQLLDAVRIIIDLQRADAVPEVMTCQTEPDGARAIAKPVAEGLARERPAIAAESREEQVGLPEAREERSDPVEIEPQDPDPRIALGAMPDDDRGQLLSARREIFSVLQKLVRDHDPEMGIFPVSGVVMEGRLLPGAREAETAEER